MKMNLESGVSLGASPNGSVGIADNGGSLENWNSSINTIMMKLEACHRVKTSAALIDKKKTKTIPLTLIAELLPVRLSMYELHADII